MNFARLTPELRLGRQPVEVPPKSAAHFSSPFKEYAAAEMPVLSLT